MLNVTDVCGPQNVLHAIIARLSAHNVDLKWNGNTPQKFSKHAQNYTLDVEILNNDPVEILKDLAEKIFNDSQRSLSEHIDSDEKGRTQLKAGDQLRIPKKLELSEKTTLDDFIRECIKGQDEQIRE